MTETPDNPYFDWFKSSYSNDQGGNCVECAHIVGGSFAVRDSKDPTRGAFVFAGRSWRRFTRTLREGNAAS